MSLLSLPARADDYILPTLLPVIPPTHTPHIPHVAMHRPSKKWIQPTRWMVLLLNQSLLVILEGDGDVVRASPAICTLSDVEYLGCPHGANESHQSRRLTLDCSNFIC